MKFKTPSPAMVIACIALFVVLGGGAYAAKKKMIKLPKGSVKAKAIAEGAVTEKKIKNGAVTQAKLAPGVGSTPAYARVTNPAATGQPATPAADAANTKAVTVAATTGSPAAEGQVCLDAATAVKSLNATAETPANPADKPVVAQVVLAPGSVCSASADALVLTRDSTTGAPVNADFYVSFSG